MSKDVDKNNLFRFVAGENVTRRKVSIART
jgi:hypothetical protein